MVLPVSFGVRVLESPSCWPYAKVLLIYAFENRTLLIFRGVRYLFLLTMYFTIDINVVLRTLLTTRFTRRRSFAYLLLLFFWTIPQAVENEVLFNSFVWSRNRVIVSTKEPPTSVVAVLVYNALYNVSHVGKARRFNVGLCVRTPSLGHQSCVS